MQNLTNLKGPVYTQNFCAVEKESFISLPDYQFSPQHNMSRKDCSIITSSTLVGCEGGGIKGEHATIILLWGFLNVTSTNKIRKQKGCEAK